MANEPSLPILPDELIEEILLRLPVRSLVQFRCVCKSWKTLLSHPQFAKRHMQRLNSTTYPQIVASTTTNVHEIISYAIKPLLENPSTPVEPVRFSRGYNYPNIIGSCNGLLCLFDFNQFCVSLWNPSINLKSKRSPAIVSPHDNNIVRYFGFGYDQLNDKYKVIVDVSDLNDYTKVVTKIYTFGENSWKMLQNFPINPYMHSGNHVSGTLNWIAIKNSVESKEVIISFDLVKETYREVLLPQHDGYNVLNYGLSVLSNCLCVYFDHFYESRWALWMMKEYGVFESWTKLMIISYENLIWNYPRHRPFVAPLFISENRVVLLLNTTTSQPIQYNINNGAVDYPCPLGKVASNLHIYHESLVSPQR